jgi:hypothetical protein
MMLPHTWLSHQHRVVLGAPQQDVAPQLPVPANSEPIASVLEMSCACLLHSLQHYYNAILEPSQQ